LKIFTKLNTRKTVDTFFAPDDSPDEDSLTDASRDEDVFGGYDELLTQPVVNSYPEDAAKLFFEELRLALREGRVQPSFARGA